MFEGDLLSEGGDRFRLAIDASMTAMVALARADTVMAWDREDRRLIVANIVGQMPWTVRGDSS